MLLGEASPVESRRHLQSDTFQSPSFTIGATIAIFIRSTRSRSSFDSAKFSALRSSAIFWFFAYVKNAGLQCRTQRRYFQPLYLAVLWAIVTCEQRANPTYRLMAALGIFHVVGLSASGFCTGFLSIEGAVFCTRPTLIYFVGVAGLGMYLNFRPQKIALKLEKTFCCSNVFRRLGRLLGDELDARLQPMLPFVQPACCKRALRLRPRLALDICVLCVRLLRPLDRHAAALLRHNHGLEHKSALWLFRRLRHHI